MAWIRMDDQFPDNPKLIEAGSQARDLYWTAQAYANRQRSDGVLSRRRALTLVDYTDVAMRLDSGEVVWDQACAGPALDRLIAARLLHADGHDCERCAQPGPGQLIIHDYLEYQLSKAEMEKRAAETTARVAAWRRKRKEAETSGEDGGNSTCNGVTPSFVTDGKRLHPNPNPKVTTTDVVVTQGGAGGGLAVVPEPGKPPRKRGSRIPSADWMPKPETVEVIKSDFPAATPDDLRRAHDRFIDWAVGSGSRNAVKLDWDATWRGWMRRELPAANGHGGHGHGGHANGHGHPSKLRALVQLAAQADTATPTPLELL